MYNLQYKEREWERERRHCRVATTHHGIIKTNSDQGKWRLDSETRCISKISTLKHHWQVSFLSFFFFTDYYCLQNWMPPLEWVHHVTTWNLMKGPKPRFVRHLGPNVCFLYRYLTMTRPISMWQRQGLRWDALVCSFFLYYFSNSYFYLRDQQWRWIGPEILVNLCLGVTPGGHHYCAVHNTKNKRQERRNERCVHSYLVKANS